MRRAILMVLLGAVATISATSQKPSVPYAALESVQRNFDNVIPRLNINDPFDLLGTTRGIYLAGYGAVFTNEVNLVVSPFSPFHHQPVGPDLRKLHDKKVARLAVLKATVKKMMLDSVSALDMVPPNEQVVVGVTLFYRPWEQRDGLPSQIIVQTTRQMLVDFKAGRISPAQFDAGFQVQEL